jgi:hypothetical protein
MHGSPSLRAVAAISCSTAATPDVDVLALLCDDQSDYGHTAASRLR